MKGGIKKQKLHPTRREWIINKWIARAESSTLAIKYLSQDLKIALPRDYEKTARRICEIISTSG